MLCALSIILAENSTCSSKQFSRLCYSAAAAGAAGMNDDCCCWGQRVCNDFLGVIFQQGDGKCVWSKNSMARSPKWRGIIYQPQQQLQPQLLCPLYSPTYQDSPQCSLTILFFIKSGQEGLHYLAFKYIHNKTLSQRKDTSFK